MDIKLENLNFYLYKKMDGLIHNKIFKNKKIILFGLNSTSYCTKNYLESKGLLITAYIDNDSKKRDDLNQMKKTLLRNHLNNSDFELMKSKIIEAYAPEELLQYLRDDVVILIGSKYYSDMCTQLSKLGFFENKQVYQTIDFYALEKLLSENQMPSGYERLNDEEVRLRQLELLDFLKKTCEEHKLRYYLCGGTLLGAVRHGGYIPWDDDIDIAMPLGDYKKFLEIIRENEHFMSLSIYSHPESYYNFFMRLIDKETLMKSWEYPFLMTSGVSIDIFPLFGLPEREEDIRSFYNRIRDLNASFIRTYIEEATEDDLILKQRMELRVEIIRMMEQYDFDKSRMIGYLLSKYKEKEIMPRTIYQDQIKLRFEGKEYSAASGYIDYLTILFRNYMELPPEKERYNTHNYIAYQKNNTI